MAVLALTQLNGVTINGASNYVVTVPYGGSGTIGASAALRSRTGRFPEIDAIAFSEKVAPFQAFQRRGAGVADDQFDQDIHGLFAPLGSEVTVQATANSITLQNSVVVTDFHRVAGADLYAGTFLFKNPVWRSTSTSTDSASPLTNGGSVRAQPTITITPTTSTVRRRRVTVTDNTLRGLANQLILASYDSTLVSASATSDYATFFRGRLVPQRVNSPNTNPSKHWFRMDVPPGGSEIVDIYYGSSVANTALADTLEYGGVNIEGATVSNTAIEWNDYRCSLFPNVPWSWKPVRFGQMFSGVSFGISSEGASASKTGYANTITLKCDPSLSLGNDHNALLMVIGSEAGTSNALTNFYASFTATQLTPKARLLYRVAGSTVWQEREARTTTGAFATTQDIDNAVELLICLEALDPLAAGTLEVGVSGSNPQLALTNTPTVSVAAAVTARRLHGTITNTTTGDVITFDDVFTDDEALTINCLTKRITTATGTPWYSGGEGITFSNRDDWFPLAVGSNAWTVGIDATVSIAWENSYLL